jgi:hypothetical protein
MIFTLLRLRKFLQLKNLPFVASSLYPLSISLSHSLAQALIANIPFCPKTLVYGERAVLPPPRSLPSPPPSQLGELEIKLGSPTPPPPPPPRLSNSLPNAKPQKALDWPGRTENSWSIFGKGKNGTLLSFDYRMSLEPSALILLSQYEG